MPNPFVVLFFVLVLLSAVVAVIQLIKKDYDSLGEIIGRILLGVLFLYLHLK